MGVMGMRGACPWVFSVPRQSEQMCGWVRPQAWGKSAGFAAALMAMGTLVLLFNGP